MQRHHARSLFASVRPSHAICARRKTRSYIEWVTNRHPLNRLSDDALLRRLSELVQNSRRVEADVIAHIAEVDARKLYREQAAFSMFSYCTDVLHFSEHEAYLRISAARAAREHPVLLGMLAGGRIHLSGISKLAPHLTVENRDELLKRATHRSKRKIEELIAELRPCPDAPTTVRKLAVRRPRLENGTVQQGAARPAAFELGPDRVAEARANPAAPARVQPLAPDRYKIQFTASAELREKLERLQALMRSSVPDGDLGAIIDQAVTEQLERLEAKRFGKARARRKTVAKADASDASDASASSRYIPASIRRSVHERDGGRCTFEDRRGRRCKARDRLEFHHHDRPFGRGGDHRPNNLRLMCRAHNTLLAEREYGREWMDQFGRQPIAGAT